MTSDEIRRRYLDFFAAQDHRVLPSASLIPAEHDPSVLFTVAGMVPFKPYFLGRERPPHPRVTTCQKTFRTVDIEIIGTTTRHLTLFEMLGNFSFGDYFKAGAIRYAWDLSRDGFGFDPERIWITVFAGDDELGIGPDREAIDAWLEVGVPRERIVECGRSENFWQMGPTGPCGPCSELYLDRGLAFGAPEDLPGGENERFLEYWNLVFMQYDQNPPGKLTPLPAQNIDTGLGLNRLAAILQDKETVFETDQFAPLIALGEELSGRRYGSDFATDRALRILADHSRAMAFLIGDGVVPSNEDRGYVLRRVIRRAILQGRHTLGLDPGFLGPYAERVIEVMGGHYSELVAQREVIERWLSAEEEGFGRTLTQGSKLLDELMDRARETGAEGISGADAFRLHDTYGFPIDLTLELVAEQDLGVDEAGFEVLMDDQRTRARAGAGRGRASGELRELAIAFAGGTAAQTEFVGYETVERETTVAALATEGDGLLLKLEQSPFYATGGGQIADAGWVECLEGDCRGRVTDVVRLGDDQVLAVMPERGALEPGERVRAQVDRAARHATECNHTATHLLHAALRAHLGDHVHQAGSYVGPDKLRFDFTHGSGLSPDGLAEIEDAVNRWVLESHPVRAVTTTLDEARRLGAMALFGEKYGDVVRMVEVGEGSFSRELCGGTHVRTTSEIGLFTVLSESSSAANVRRIEAVTGPEAVSRARAQSAQLAATAHELRVPVERVAETAHDLRARVRTLEKAERAGDRAGVDLDALLAAASEVDGASVLTAPVTGAGDGKALMALADQLRARLGDSAVVVGSPGEGRVDLVAAVAPALVARGVRAGELVRVAASAVGGGGGGRDTIARAGGRDPDGLPEALRVAREAIETALRASR
ncbi:MAG TPA: alanine--tRNA ligase [Solirubrobacteraceae bacterium]|nr:alanine--tRNA ligase [Solirubrobacteraceae bacterium]